MTPYPQGKNYPFWHDDPSVGMVINWGRCPKMFFNLSPKALADSPMYSSSCSGLLHMSITLLFCVILSMSLGANTLLMVLLPPPKVDLDAYLITNDLETFAKTCVDIKMVVVGVGCYCPLNCCGPVCCCTYGCS